MGRKRILFVVSNLKVGGGAEKSVTMLVKGLKEYHDVEVLTFYDFEKEYPCSVKRHSFKYKYRESLLCKAYRLLFLFPLKIKRFLKKNKYDLVVSNAEDANVTCLISKKYFKNYKLWVVIRNDVFDKKHPYKRFNFLQKSADKRITISKSLAKKYEKNAGKKAITIYNAFDFEELKKNSSGKILSEEENIFRKGKVLITIGRLSDQKNYLFLIKAFSKILEANGDVKLVILGNGPLKEKIVKEIKNKKLEKNVFLLGIKKNIYPYLKKSDVFVLASNYEGFGRVIVEAMSVGLPVVSNNCYSGPAEILDEALTEDLKLKKYKKAKYGYLVPFNNEKEFVKAIEDALKNGTKYKNKAIKRAKDFSVEKITKKLNNIINKN